METLHLKLSAPYFYPTRRCPEIKNITRRVVGLIQSSSQRLDKKEKQLSDLCELCELCEKIKLKEKYVKNPVVLIRR